MYNIGESDKLTQDDYDNFNRNMTRFNKLDHGAIIVLEDDLIYDCNQYLYDNLDSIGFEIRIDDIKEK